MSRTMSSPDRMEESESIQEDRIEKRGRGVERLSYDFEGSENLIELATRYQALQEQNESKTKSSQYCYSSTVATRLVSDANCGHATPRLEGDVDDDDDEDYVDPLLQHDKLKKLIEAVIACLYQEDPIVKTTARIFADDGLSSKEQIAKIILITKPRAHLPSPVGKVCQSLSQLNINQIKEGDLVVFEALAQCLKRSYTPSVFHAMQPADLVLDLRSSVSCSPRS